MAETPLRTFGFSCVGYAPSVATLAVATNEAAVKDLSIRSLQRFKD